MCWSLRHVRLAPAPATADAIVARNTLKRIQGGQQLGLQHSASLEEQVRIVLQIILCLQLIVLPYQLAE